MRIDWSVWSPHGWISVWHSSRHVTIYLFNHWFLRTPLTVIIQGVTGYFAKSTHCCCTGCYWMVPVRHFLLLYMTLLNGWRTPLIAVVQGVIGRSLYATSCCYTWRYWMVGELHSLLLYRLLLDGLYATSCCYAGWGKDTWHSMFNMFLLLSDFWATQYILRMEVVLREL